MSKYSEMMGSFVRTGNYPLEANYVFNSESDLIEFYSDELNATTMHIGLLRVVLQDSEGLQSLWWVVLNKELEFKKLLSLDSFSNLELVLKDLELEIEDRKNADDTIWGDSDHTNIPSDLNSILKLSEAIKELRERITDCENIIKAIVGTENNILYYLLTLDYKNLTELSLALNKFLNTIDEEDHKINTLPELLNFLEGYTDQDKLKDLFKNILDDIYGDPLPSEEFRTLRGIEDFVRLLKSQSENSDANLLTELNLTQLGVGLDSDGKFSADLETNYLREATSVMNALKILDSLINEAINNVNLQSGGTDTVNINIVKEKSKTTIYANVKLSSESGNDIQSKNDGLYHNVDSEYENGILTIKVNGEIRKQHILGLSTIVLSAKYDPSQEAIVIVFKLQSGETQEIIIPVGALISEWEVDNSISDKVVELNKERIIGSGADKLSADVRLSSDKYNILKKDGNTLLVDGRADNIVYEGDITVKGKLDQLLTTSDTQNTSINKLTEDLTAEIHNREISEQDIKNEANKLKARVETNEINISDLQSRASTLESGLQLEINDRTSSDLDLLNKIDALNTRVDNNDSKTQGILEGLIQVNNKLTEEIQSRIDAETTLQSNITAEETRATLVEQDLQNLINTANASIYTNADNISTLTSDLADEIKRAKDAEQAIKDSEHIYNNTQSVAFDKQGNVVSATVKIAGSDNNIIKVKDDAAGIYATVDIGYNAIENKIWLVTSAGNTLEVQLSEGNIIDDITYDVNEKALILTYTANGVLKQTKFPVADLFNDWIVKNPTEGSAIELHKEYNVKDPNSNDTPDTLSARLLIADAESNAALIIGNGLYVSNKETIANTKAIEELLSNLDSINKDLLAEIQRAKDAESTLDTSIKLEATRAESKDEILELKIESAKSELSVKVDSVSSKVSELDTYTKSELSKKVERVELLNSTDLNYTILVDGLSIGTIKIPEDQYFVNADLIGNIIRLTYKLNSETIIKDIDLTGVLKDSMSDANSSLNNILSRLDTLSDAIQAEILRATTKEVTLENTILREIDRAKDEESDILDEVHHLTDRFEQHINDFDNPHRVSKDDVGLGNVDNTSDMDKPISSAVLDALNKKADIIHYHTKADITDLEDMPVIVNGFVSLLTELPSDPARGDKYVLYTYSGSNSYTYELVEWDADAQGWKLKLITTGGVACVIDENIWKLNSTGPERVLDSSDYKYFYNKIYDETKDLIEDIDWEEDDTNDTNGQIRLKITYKTKYGNPDTEGESEVTNPYTNKAVKYIDIDKARFLSNAYSRPAVQADLDKGYAATIGEPMLILVFTTGDYVAIRLNELMNIYDPVETHSIDMEVTDWTGVKDNSYKISADVKIAATKAQDNSISIHINTASGDLGIYATLHTQTTNSITLNPSTGTSGLKYLTADLKIDNSLNDVNDIYLSISSSGLSAKLVIGDYD